MGFYLRCALAKVDDEVLAARIADAMRVVFPAFVKVRYLTSPFAGVIAGSDPRDIEDEDAVYVVDDRLPELSRLFPDVRFAYIDVDCFGGTCRYNGRAITNGEVTAHETFSSDAHVKLFGHLGVENPQWYFPPFTRDWMETGTDAETGRRPTTCYVRASWTEAFAAASIRARMLPPPWRVTIQTARDCIVVYGDDLAASINTVDDHVELRLQSHVDPETTRTLAAELVDVDVALVLGDANGKPL